MSKVVCALGLAFLSFAWMTPGIGQVSSGETVGLALVSTDATQPPTLELMGSGGTLRLEASTNFLQWFTLVSAPATNGPLRFTHHEAPDLRTVYYRGSVVTDAPLPKITAETDANAVAVGMITPENGGRLSLTNSGGIQFTFTVAPSNVVSAVSIQMQVITNFVSFPYENDLRVGVKFEPDGFTFDGAGLLEIRFPTNIPPLQVTSFGFAGDGGEFHLKPDLATTNTVRIPVTHFSSVGTGLWPTTQRANAITRAAENFRDKASHDLGIRIGEERQRQLLGSEGEGSTLGVELLQKSTEYFNNYLKPFFAEARNDCSLARFLIRETLGLGRQAQLLGLEDGPWDVLFASEDFKAWTCNCLKEAMDACNENRIGAQTFARTWLGMERQAALLGQLGGDSGAGSVIGDCGFGTFEGMVEKLPNLPCMPEWVGTASYSGEGTKTTTVPERTTTATASLTVEAVAERAEKTEELSIPPFFVMERWEVDFISNSAAGSFESRGVSRYSAPCGTVVEIDSYSTQGNGEIRFTAEFSFENGELADFSFLNGDDASLEMPGSRVRTTTYPPCEGKPGTGSTITETFKPTTFISTIPVDVTQIEWTSRTPQLLEGTFTGTLPGIDSIPHQVKWKFRLERKPRTH